MRRSFEDAVLEILVLARPDPVSLDDLAFWLYQDRYSFSQRQLSQVLLKLGRRRLVVSEGSTWRAL